MLNYTLFKGELCGTSLKDIAVDYGTNVISERLENVKGILNECKDFFIEYFNQNDEGRNYFVVNLTKNNTTSESDAVCKKIENLANYLLFCDEAKALNRKSKHPYLTSYKCSNIAKNESDFEFETAVDKNAGKEVDVGNYKKIGKLSVNKDDIKNIPTMSQLQDMINLCKTKIDTYDSFINQNIETGTTNPDITEQLKVARMEKSKFEKLMSVMKDNQKFVKMMVTRPIYFKQPLRDSTCYDLSCIDLGNPVHIIVLLDNYASFKKSTYDDLHSDLKYILMDLDNLVDSTDLQPYELDIITMKIDGLTGNEILSVLMKKYNLEWDASYLSKVYREVIPKKIAQEYTAQYTDWYYTEIERGEYKECGKCGEIKLVSSFSPKSDAKDGLHPYCKKCRKTVSE